MIRDLLKNLITKILTNLNWPGLDVDINEIAIEKPSNPDFGDYAVNIAFTLAKQFKKPPQEVAQILAEEIGKIKPAEIEQVEAVGGYVNFFLSDDFLRRSLAVIYKNRKTYGKSKNGSPPHQTSTSDFVAKLKKCLFWCGGKGQKIIVEYSQPNIAKQMHIGHLRTTVLGDALANIYEAFGYKVIRWNYLGDWGTQFGKLIAAYKLWGNQLRGSTSQEVEPLSKKNLTIKDLTWLYVKFHRELKGHPELDRRGQEEFAKLEAGDKENRKLWEWFCKLSIKEFKKIYKLLGINFDIWLGESHFEKDLKLLVDGLHQRGIAEIGKEGAIIIDFKKHAANLQGRSLQGPSLQGPSLQVLQDLPPALIQKADGASLYLTRDIAALKYRLSKYKPAKLLYVVGNEQSLHFEQLFTIAKILGWDKSELEHIKYGLVLGEDKKKMSTREGEAISLEEVISKAIELAKKITLAKTQAVRSPTSNSRDIEKIAKTVAIGALKYEMLKEHRSSDIVFGWERMLDFTGNSAPYLQYTYARLASILRKAGFTWKLGFQVHILRSDLGKLEEKSEMAIIKHLLDFPDVIADSARANLTNNLALYLYELANLANQFYETVPVFKGDPHTKRGQVTSSPEFNGPRYGVGVSRRARLILIQTTASVLKTGLKLLGIEVLERI